MDRAGIIEGEVLDERYYPSPIPKGGLEILLKVMFKIADEKSKYLKRLIEFVKEISKV